MVFSAGVLDLDRAHRRFDEMLERAAELPYAKQPVIERRTGSFIGYSGVNTFEFEKQRRLEDRGVRDAVRRWSLHHHAGLAVRCVDGAL